MFISNAYAQAAGGAGGGEGSLLVSLLPIVLIFVIFYFLLYRPQQRKMKAHKEMVANLRRNDKIVTAGGFVGTVTKVIDESYVQVEIADGVRVKVVRGTITDVIAKTDPVANDDKDK
ncbi:MAG: preprotein translocase subunit YajC [Pseudomonadota bacterium]